MMPSSPGETAVNDMIPPHGLLLFKIQRSSQNTEWIVFLFVYMHQGPKFRQT